MKPLPPEGVVWTAIERELGLVWAFVDRELGEAPSIEASVSCDEPEIDFELTSWLQKRSGVRVRETREVGQLGPWSSAIGRTRAEAALAIVGKEARG
jgi:hypothetical protein